MPTIPDCAEVDGKTGPYTELVSYVLSHYHTDEVNKLPKHRPVFCDVPVMYCLDRQHCAVKLVMLSCPPFPIPLPCKLEVFIEEKNIKQVDAELLSTLSQYLPALKGAIPLLKSALQSGLKTLNFDKLDSLLKSVNSLLYSAERELLRLYPSLPKLEDPIDRALAEACPHSFAYTYVQFLKRLEEAYRLAKRHGVV
jgi:hypothetical protein